MRYGFVIVAVPLIVLSFEGRSLAQGIAVGDGLTEEATQSTAESSEATAQSAQTIQNTTQTIQTETNDIQQQTDSHLPNVDKDTAVLNQAQGQVSGMFTQDDGQSLQNSMPTASVGGGGDQLESDISYNSPQLTATGQTIFAQNNFGMTMGTDTGTDPEAAAVKAQLTTAANIQGMAHDNLAALQARLAELSDMNNQLAGATNITAIEAIRGRIEVESLMVQTQEAQASNLAALASAQQEIDKENDAQAIRQEHQQTASLFQSAARGVGAFTP